MVELMVTISIISILTAAMLPAMRTFERQNKMKIAVQQLKAAISEAKNYALAPRSEDTSANAYRRYAVRIGYDKNSPNPTEYEIGYSESAPSKDLPANLNWTVISHRKLPSGVEVARVCPTLSGDDHTAIEIGFEVPEAKVVLDRIYTYTNWENGVGGSLPCSPDNSENPVAAGGPYIWKTKAAAGADSPEAVIELRDKFGRKETIYVHSYSGRIIVE